MGPARFTITAPTTELIVGIYQPRMEVTSASHRFTPEYVDIAPNLSGVITSNCCTPIDNRTKAHVC